MGMPPDTKGSMSSVRVSFTLIKTDSAQSSSNKWKNYLLQIYSQHGNFLNTI